MDLLKDVLIDTCLDSVKMLPFLFAAFLLIEALEHYSGEFTAKALAKVGKAGPVVGAVAGCVPQCGFSVMASNLYAGGVVSVGTLLSVFIATSDEAILIIMGNPGYLTRDVFLCFPMKILWICFWEDGSQSISTSIAVKCARMKSVDVNTEVQESLCRHGVIQ